MMKFENSDVRLEPSWPILDLLVVTAEFAGSFRPRKLVSVVRGTIFDSRSFSMMKFENLDVRFAILEVTESLLVVTAGFPMVKSCYGLSREVWATSGTHFPAQIAPSDMGAK